MRGFYTCVMQSTDASVAPLLPDYAALAARIKAFALDAGFQRCGISGIELGEDETFLHDWLAQGMHGSMDWMARHGDKRARPQALVPGTVRVLSVGMDYGRDPQQAWDFIRSFYQLEKPAA